MTLSCCSGVPERNRSGSDSAGQSSGGSLSWAQVVADRRSRAPPARRAGSPSSTRSPPGRSGRRPCSVTSISPDTPVASCSSFTSLSAWRSRGTSSRTSEIDLGLRVGHPAERARRPARSSARAAAAASARSTARRPQPASLRPTRARRTARRALVATALPPVGRARRAARGSTGGTSGAPLARSGSARRSPAVSAQASATKMPDHEQGAEAAHHRHRREQQHQEADGGGQAGGGDRRPARAGRRGRAGGRAAAAPPRSPRPPRSAPGTGSQ